MRVIIRDNYDDMSYLAAYYIYIKIIEFKPTETKPFVIGLPTGSTPLGFYKNLITMYRKKMISFKNIITFNMDEYVGLEKNNDQSYYYFMKKNFFNHIDIPEKNINFLDGMADDLEKECQRYESKIAQYGGINLFVAGVGTDGHLAFNEPGSSLLSRTRIKTLCQKTIIDNSRFFKESILDVPSTSLTVGLGTIMDSQEVIVLVSGIDKSFALKQCLEGSINHTWTITCLQNHKKVLIVCDDDSTQELQIKTVNYYKNLQVTTNINGKYNLNNMSKYISKSDNVLIFSPHPDDDVIGLGGTMQKFNINNTHIVYMTDGSGGYDKGMYEYNPRKQEAILSLKILGYSKNNISFLELPFYKKKSSITTGETINDYNILKNVIHTKKPKHIFICNDVDPNKTHVTCHKIIYNALQSFRNTNIYIWLYNSAWGDWGNIQTNCTSFLTNSEFEKKKLAIMIHDSQDPPKINYGNKQPFYKSIIKKNKSKLNPGLFEEKFIVQTIDNYLDNKKNSLLSRN